jgi:two-component system response regulator DesR
MSATRTLRVMLVEDNDIFRELLAFVLGHEPDFEVVAKTSSLAEARETLEGCLDERLDVAVVDLSLPDGDGTELIDELRRSNPGISVVVLSATIGAGKISEVRKAGADTVLDKVRSYSTIAEELRRLTSA